MRNKLLGLIFAFCLIIPSVFFFTACSSKGNVQVRVSEDYVQWSEDGLDWKSVISIADVKDVLGDAYEGKQGQPGAAGINGKQVEFRYSGNYIQWRYVGDSDDTWANLVSKSDLQGPKGDQGESGAVTYTITFDYSVAEAEIEDYFDGIVDSLQIESNQWLTDLPTIKPAYANVFEGWFIQGTDREVRNYDFIGGDVTLEARIRLTETCIVTLDPRGGSGLTQTVFSVTRGQTLNEAGERLSYNISRADNEGFVGWYDREEGGNFYSSYTIINSDVTLYAQYEQSGNAYPSNWTGKCMVVLNPQVGSVLDWILVENGQSFSAAGARLPTNLTRVGYLLDGWYDSITGGTKYTNDTAIYGDISLTEDMGVDFSGKLLYAHWIEDESVVVVPTCIVTFMNDDESICYIQEVQKNKSLAEVGVNYLPVVYREDYRLDGWYDYKIGGTKYTVNTPIIKDTVLYPHWIEDNELNTTCVVGCYDGTRLIEKIFVEQGACVTLPTDMAKDGYVFVGWFDKMDEMDGGTQYTDNTPIEDNISLYAHWEKNYQVVENTSYTVTFMVGDSVWDVAESGGSSSIERPADPIPSAGQTFVGWFVGDKEFDFNTQPTADVEVTAKFVSTAEQTFTITYDLNKTYIMGLSDPVLTDDEANALLATVVPEQYAQTDRYSEQRTADWKFTAPNEPELTGYFFDGWYVNADCTDATTKLTATSTFNADTIVYAKWVKGIPEATDPEVDPYFLFEPGTQNTVLKGLTAEGKKQNYLEIPNTVVTISATFGSGTTKQNLVQLVIPNSVTTICRDAFTNMYALWIVNIADNQVIKDENNVTVNLKDKATAEKYFANGANVDRMYIGPKDDTKAKMETSAGIVHYKNNIVKVKGKGLDYAVTVAKDTKATNPTAFDLTNETFTHITGYCFYGCTNLTSVTLPRCLEQIGYRAFYNCTHLSSITFVGADNNTSSLSIIGKAAFSNCTALTSIVIPSSVQVIYWQAFHQSGLTSATFVNKYFWSTSSTPSAEYVAIILTDPHECNPKVTSQCVYGDVNGDMIIDQNDVDMINRAIYGVVILDAVAELRADVNLDGAVNAQDVKILEIVINKNFVIPVPATTLSSNTSKGGRLDVNSDGTFDDKDYTSLNTKWNNGITTDLTEAEKTKCDINNDGIFNVTDLNLLAYMLGGVSGGQSSNEEVNPYFIFESGSSNTVLKGLTTLGKKQNELIIPEGVTTIAKSFGDASSSNGQNLVRLTIPNSVTTICRGAFVHMYALWIVDGKTSGLQDEDGVSIDFSDLATAKAYFANGGYVDNMYIGAVDATKARVETSVNGIVHYKNLVKNLDFAATVAQASKSSVVFDLTIERFTQVTGYAFYGCNSLTTILLPRCLEQIGFRAFFNCKELSSVTFVGADKNTSSLRSIGKAAFRDCESLTSFVIPAGVNYIGYNAFINTALSSVEFKYADYWYIGNTQLNPDNLSNVETAATYLTQTYVSKNFNAYVLGDVNGDLSIDDDDILWLTQAVNGTQDITTPELKIRADLNADGNINSLDIRILEIVINKNFVIPVPATTLSLNTSKGGRLDVNGDGTFDDEDYTALNAKWNNGITTDLTEAEKTKCDIDNDGIFNAADLNLLAYMLG